MKPVKLVPLDEPLDRFLAGANTRLFCKAEAGFNKLAILLFISPTAPFAPPPDHRAENPAVNLNALGLCFYDEII